MTEFHNLMGIKKESYQSIKKQITKEFHQPSDKESMTMKHSSMKKYSFNSRKRSRLNQSASFVRDGLMSDASKQDIREDNLNQQSSNYLLKHTDASPLKFKMKEEDTSQYEHFKSDFKLNDSDLNRKYQMAQFESLKVLEISLRNKIYRTLKEDLILDVLKSGNQLEKLHLKKYFLHILSKKNVKSIKDMFFDQILKAKDNLEDCNVSDIYLSVLKNRKSLSLKDEMVREILECEDIEDLDLLPFVQHVLSLKKKKSGQFLSLRQLAILNCIDSQDDLSDFDYVKIFSKVLDNRKKANPGNTTEKEELLARVVGTSNDLDNLKLEDKLLQILNRRLAKDNKSELLKSVIKAKNDLDDLDIIPHLKNQLSIPQDNWCKKEWLLHIAVKANNHLDQVDLYDIHKQVLDQKKVRDKRYVQSPKDKLLIKSLNANDNLDGVSFDENMLDSLYKKQHYNDREEMLIRTLNCKEDLTNLLMLDKVEKQLQQVFDKNYSMSLQKELLFKTLKSGQDLRGLELFPYYEHVLKNKVLDNVELLPKEEVIHRIIKSNANYDGINLDDIIVQSLKNKDNRNLREELIYRSLRADDSLYGLKLDDIFVKVMRMNQMKTFRDEVMIRVFEFPNEDLEFFEFDDIAERILQFIEKSKRTQKQNLLYKVYTKRDKDLERINSQRQLRMGHKKGKKLIQIESLIKNGYKRQNCYKLAIRGIDMGVYRQLHANYTMDIDSEEQVNTMVKNIHRIKDKVNLKFQSLENQKEKMEQLENVNLKSKFFEFFKNENNLFQDISLFGRKNMLKYIAIKSENEPLFQVKKEKLKQLPKGKQASMLERRKTEIQQIDEDSGRITQNQSQDLFINKYVNKVFNFKFDIKDMYTKIGVRDDKISLEQSFADARIRKIFEDANSTKQEWERILAHAMLIVDYRNRGYILHEEFLSLLFFQALFVRAFGTFYEIDNNRADRIDIFKFMNWVQKEGLELTNPFREFHAMDKEKDMNISVEKWIMFQGRNFLTTHWQDLKDTPVMKYFWKSFRYNRDSDCKFIFDALANGSEVKKNDFSNWFGYKATNLKPHHVNKIISVMRKVFALFDADNSGAIDWEEFQEAQFQLELYFDAYYSFCWIDQPGNLSFAIKDLKSINSKLLQLPTPYQGKPVEIIRRFEEKKGKGSVTMETWVWGQMEVWAQKENMIKMREISDEINQIFSQVKMQFEDQNESKVKVVSERDVKKDILAVKNSIHQMTKKVNVKNQVGDKLSSLKTMQTKDFKELSNDITPKTNDNKKSPKLIDSFKELGIKDDLVDLDVDVQEMADKEFELTDTIIESKPKLEIATNVTSIENLNANERKISIEIDLR